MEIAEIDDTYYSKLLEISQKIKKIVSPFASALSIENENNLSILYSVIAKKNLLTDFIKKIVEIVNQTENPYFEFCDNFSMAIKLLNYTTDNLGHINYSLLSLEQVETEGNIVAYFSELKENAVKKMLAATLLKIGIELNNTEKTSVHEDAIYILANICCIYYGTVNKAKEKLIMIDEAQNFEPSELEFIKAVNPGVILNLFGDEKQHIENTKGINTWTDLKNVADFQICEMNENYRNARQITEYCNISLGMKMMPVNLAGAGVHEILSFDEFEEDMEYLFFNKQKKGLNSIIVKSSEEADVFISLFHSHVDKINNLISDENEIQFQQWNLLTVEQAKGLEFTTVVVLSKQMTKNERYIAFTRALNELYLYDGLLETKNNPLYENQQILNSTEKVVELNVRKRTKRTIKKLSDITE